MEEIRVCPECEASFMPGSPKQKFDSIKCKNRFNHRRTKEAMQWELRQIKKRKKNIKILSSLKRKYRYGLTKADLKLLGFDLTVCYAPIKMSESEFAYRFGNIYLVIIENARCKILTSQEYEATTTQHV